MKFGIHICRGNGPGWHREGHYDAIAEKLFGGLNHDRLLLNTTQTAPAAFCHFNTFEGAVAVLGLVSTKISRVETVDELRKRIDEASRYLPLEQLALSPQCGFGALITEDDQWRKIDLD